MLILLRLRFLNLSGYFIKLNTNCPQNLFLHYIIRLFIHILLTAISFGPLLMSPTSHESSYYRKEQSWRSLRLTTPLFANLKILDVFSIYSLQVSSFMFLYHNDALPISFTQIFQTGNKIHQYLTRYSDCYRPHTCRTNIFDPVSRTYNMEFFTEQHQKRPKLLM